jgi:hypothetical protein
LIRVVSACRLINTPASQTAAPAQTHGVRGAARGASTMKYLACF